MIDMYEFFGIVVSIKFFDVPSLEFLWPPDLRERCSQSTKTTPSLMGKRLLLEIVVEESATLL
jgi:hypothetical protein